MTETTDPIARLLGDEHDAITLRRVLELRFARRQVLPDIFSLATKDDVVSLFHEHRAVVEDLLHDLGLPRHRTMRRILVGALAQHDGRKSL